jgi:hypothetical protein
VVAPTQDGGTAIMAMRSPSAVTPAFGGPSAARHVAAARRAARSVAHLEHHDGYRDVDSFADLREALLCGVGAATLEVIHRALKQPASHDDGGGGGRRKNACGCRVGAAILRTLGSDMQALRLSASTSSVSGCRTGLEVSDASQRNHGQKRAQGNIQRTQASVGIGTSRRFLIGSNTGCRAAADLGLQNQELHAPVERLWAAVHDAMEEYPMSHFDAQGRGVAAVLPRPATWCAPAVARGGPPSNGGRPIITWGMRRRSARWQRSR